jgi:threonine aldolase
MSDDELPDIGDFRSDTVTRPTFDMRLAMSRAEVGDDVLGHDPTTLELERTGAAILGKEAALFMPSGTMCNLVALQTHCRPGDEVIVEEWSHTARFEGGGAGMLAHVQVRTLRSDFGLMDAGEVAGWIDPGSEHTPRTALVCVEQTHNFHGGVAVSPEGLDGIAAVAHERGVAVHMDGARLWNAEAALGRPAGELCAAMDTVSVCLSKGLGAPVGSLLAGPADFIERARFNRKRLGGGMRQSGILAAAGLNALATARERLAEDHARCERIATELESLDAFSVKRTPGQTNIVFVRCPGIDAGSIVTAAAEEQVLLYATGEHEIRLVTHRDVTDRHVDRLLEVLARRQPA